MESSGLMGKKHAQSRHRMMDNTMVTQIVINYGCTNFNKMDKSSWLHYGWCNNMQQLWSDFSVFLILLHEAAISNGYEQTWSLESNHQAINGLFTGDFQQQETMVWT